MSKIIKQGSDYIVPVTLENHIPPRTLPFYGNTSHALLYCAEATIGKFLDQLPNKTESTSAKLWLKMAVEFASARAKIVQSITWQEANEQTRFEVATELESQGAEILKYLKKFKKHWGKAVEGVDMDAIADSVPVPSHLNSSDEDIAMYRETFRQDMAIAFYYLSSIESDFSQKLLTPRTRKRLRPRSVEGKQLSLFEKKNDARD